MSSFNTVLQISGDRDFSVIISKDIEGNYHALSKDMKFKSSGSFDSVLDKVDRYLPVSSEYAVKLNKDFYDEYAEGLINLNDRTDGLKDIMLKQISRDDESFGDYNAVMNVLFYGKKGDRVTKEPLFILQDKDETVPDVLIYANQDGLNYNFDLMYKNGDELIKSENENHQKMSAASLLEFIGNNRNKSSSLVLADELSNEASQEAVFSMMVEMGSSQRDSFKKNVLGSSVTSIVKDIFKNYQRKLISDASSYRDYNYRFDMYKKVLDTGYEDNLEFFVGSNYNFEPSILEVKDPNISGPNKINLNKSFKEEKGEDSSFTEKSFFFSESWLTRYNALDRVGYFDRSTSYSSVSRNEFDDYQSQTTIEKMRTIDSTGRVWSFGNEVASLDIETKSNPGFSSEEYSKNEYWINDRLNEEKRYKSSESDFGFDSTTEYLKDGVVYQIVEKSSYEDEEGRGYTEEWKDGNGDFHREDDYARISYAVHHIPDETYLDEDVKEKYIHGKLIEHDDKTYENIISNKPKSVRQAFGYDLE